MNQFRKRIALFLCVLLILTSTAGCGMFGKRKTYSDEEKAASQKLYNGIRKGNYAMIDEALAQGANVSKIIYGNEGEYSNTVLIALYEAQNPDLALYLVGKGAAVDNEKVGLGMSVLSYAVCNREYTIIKTLLESGVEVSSKTITNGFTALDYAAYSGYATNEREAIDVFDLLLKHGAELTDKTLASALSGGMLSFIDEECQINGKLLLLQRIMRMHLEKFGEQAYISSISQAAVMGDFEAVRSQLQSCDLTAEDKKFLALYTAAFGDVKTLQALERAGVDIARKTGFDNRFTTLMAAAAYDNLENTKYLYETKKMDINAESTSVSILGYAILNQSRNTIPYLIEHGALPTMEEPIVNNYRSIGLRHDSETLNLLLKKGYIPENKEEGLMNALYFMITDSQKAAKAYGEEEQMYAFMKNLIEQGIDVDEIPYFPDLEFTKFLVEHGSNFQDNSAIFAVLKNADCVKYLAEQGANINTYSKIDGDTILMRAVDAGYTDTIKYLLAKGADLSLKEKTAQENTALFHAACSASSVLRMLLDAGTDINVKNAQGQTALFSAVRQNFPENVKILLEHGADKNIRDKDGMTVYDYAQKNNNQMLVQILNESI